MRKALSKLTRFMTVRLRSISTKICLFEFAPSEVKRQVVVPERLYGLQRALSYLAALVLWCQCD